MTEQPEHKSHFPGPARKNPGARDLGPVDPEIDGMSQWAVGRIGVVHVNTPHRPVRPWRIVRRWSLGGRDLVWPLREWTMTVIHRWWYRLRWWTPESRASRALYRYSECVWCQLTLQGVEFETAEELIQQAFLALYREYADGRKVPDAQRWVLDYALSLAQVVSTVRRQKDAVSLTEHADVVASARS